MNKWLAARDAYVTYHVIDCTSHPLTPRSLKVDELLQVPHLKAKSTFRINLKLAVIVTRSFLIHLISFEHVLTISAELH